MTETDTKKTTRCGGAKDSETTEDGGGRSKSCGGGSDGTDEAGKAGDDGDAGENEVGRTIDDFDGEPGRLVAVGMGPGHPEGMTLRAREALMEAEHVVGYTTYVDLLPDEVVEAADDVYETPMCGEVSRTEEAVDRVFKGNDVALIGSGDPNVYALAGLALEILESKGGDPDDVEFEVVPGVPAAQSCAARVGAPLVNDTVTVSLSDHLTPMEEIESRLEAVAGEGFTVAVYNPWSRKRRENYERMCEIMLEHRSPDTPVGVVHAAGRDDEEIVRTTLEELPELGETDVVDMTTTLLIGNEDTYLWRDRMVTPRGYESKYSY